MRVRSKWFAKGRPRGPTALAGVVAVTAWKLGLNTIKNMRQADFEIETGPRYFDILNEFLVFLAHVADRYAYARLGGEERATFTTAMALRLAELTAENQSRLLDGDAGELKERFVGLFNRRGEDYACFGFDPAEGPDFGFGRFLGNMLLDLVPPRDRSWVIDQVMAIEIPDAVKTMRNVFAGLEASSAA
jgi:hypothetical protein